MSHNVIHRWEKTLSFCATRIYIIREVFIFCLQHHAYIVSLGDTGCVVLLRECRPTAQEIQLCAHAMRNISWLKWTDDTYQRPLANQPTFTHWRYLQCIMLQRESLLEFSEGRKWTLTVDYYKKTILHNCVIIINCSMIHCTCVLL